MLYEKSMLYALHDLQQSLAAPWQVVARAGSELFASPLAAWMPLAREISASGDMLARMVRRYDKPSFGLDQTHIDQHDVAVFEQVVIDKPFGRLVHFQRDTPRADPRVLLVAPMSGHHATLLRDTVRTMLPEHDIFITDWADARLVPLEAGTFGLDDYVDYIIEFLRVVGPDTHVIAVCQPAVPVLAAVALLNAQNDPVAPPSMTLIGGPVDTRRGPTPVSAFAQDHSLEWFEQNVVQTVPWPHPGQGRRVYPGFLQRACFMAMNAERHFKAHQDYFENLVQGDQESAQAHRAFYDEYNAVADLPAEFYLDTLKTVFHEHALPRGEMRVHGTLIRPAAITRTALMTIEGEHDDITGAGQTLAAQELCTALPGSMRKHLCVEGVGHFGIFNGRHYRDTIHPRIRDFIRAHSPHGKTSAPTTRAAVRRRRAPRTRPA